ncbi:chemotaxis protein CheX [Azospirillum doebereinerae]
MSAGIDDLVHDALTEVINVGIGNAATRLSKIVKDEILLSVPQVTIMSRNDALRHLPGLGEEALVAVRERFSGEFSGCALLIFPEANSLELVRAALPEGCDLDEIVSTRQEAISEVGNIILNGSLSSIANSLRHTLVISLPELLQGDGRAILFNGEGCSPHEAILFAQVDFLLNARSIQGYVLLTLDLPELEDLRRILTKLVQDMVASSP